MPGPRAVLLISVCFPRLAPQANQVLLPISWRALDIADAPTNHGLRHGPGAAENSCDRGLLSLSARTPAILYVSQPRARGSDSQANVDSPQPANRRERTPISRRIRPGITDARMTFACNMSNGVRPGHGVAIGDCGMRGAQCHAGASFMRRERPSRPVGARTSGARGG